MTSTVNWLQELTERVPVPETGCESSTRNSMPMTASKQWVANC